MIAPDVVHGCAQVDAALDALERIDVSSLSDDVLHGYVGELHRLASRLVSVRSGPVAEWVGRGVWADDGSKAAHARLAREQSLTPATARTEIRRAQKLRMMPVTAGGVARGEIRGGQGGLLWRAAYKP